ncbi:hypothetical protein [Shigella sonnei]|uniref:hypothetical protein n=1 Tax=Shigella sonnei TaxID=624 RepID=UPI00311CA818
MSAAFLSAFCASFCRFSACSINDLASRGDIRRESASANSIRLSVCSRRASYPAISVRNPYSLSSACRSLNSCRVISATSAFPARSVFSVFSSFSLAAIAAERRFPASVRLFSFSFCCTLSVFLYAVISLSLFSISLRVGESSTHSFPPQMVLFPKELHAGGVP